MSCLARDCPPVLEDGTMLVSQDSRTHGNQSKKMENNAQNLTKKSLCQHQQQAQARPQECRKEVAKQVKAFADSDDERSDSDEE